MTENIEKPNEPDKKKASRELSDEELAKVAGGAKGDPAIPARRAE